MRISKKSHQLIRQNEQEVRKPQKHDVNLQKNSTLYFQIGLIVCLLATYGLLEMKFEINDFNISQIVEIDDDTPEITMDKFKIYEDKPVLLEKKKKVKLIQNPIISEESNGKEDQPEFVTEPPVTDNPPVDPGKIDVYIPIEDTEVDFISVEQVPIYPGCEKKKTNEDRKKCMSDKIDKLVRKKFDTSLGSEYNLSGVQTIRVQFKIDKTGKVTEIKTRAPHPKLQEEAERVVGKIPQMIPGKQRDTNVGVIYNLPIKLQVQD